MKFLRDEYKEERFSVKRIFSLLMLAASFLAATVNAQESRNPREACADQIRIVNILTSAPVRNGVENEFTVELEYTLESADEAMIAIGFNSDKSGAYRMTTHKKIKRGVNTITLKADVTLKDWKERGDFFAYANISPYPIPQNSRYTPLVTTNRVIDFEQ